jgi:hypothetical protein
MNVKLYSGVCCVLIAGSKESASHSIKSSLGF